MVLNLDDNTTLIISGGKITTIDWQDSNTKDALDLMEKAYSKKREENSAKFLAINSVVNSTKLLFPKHSRCDIVCKVAEFYLASNLEMTTL